MSIQIIMLDCTGSITWPEDVSHEAGHRRTQKEVVSSKGQFVCGAKGCDKRAGLASYEVCVKPSSLNPLRVHVVAALHR